MSATYFILFCIGMAKCLIGIVLVSVDSIIHTGIHVQVWNIQVHTSNLMDLIYIGLLYILNKCLILSNKL